MARLKRLIQEVHRRSLWQVLGVYVVTSWVIYQVVVALWEGLGLPEWVPPTALILLLIGLPVVLATAFVQEGPPELRRDRDEDAPAVPGLERTLDALAPRDPVRARDAAYASSPERRTPSVERRAPTLFTWSRAITGGVLAFALLGLAATGFMGMRALGIGPAATLVSKGVLGAREPILLAEFESASGDTVLAAAVTEALRVDLEQATVVTLLQPAFAQDALRRMRRDPATKLTPGVARELAVREGIKAVVVGDITSVGPAYVLTARVLSADGSVLTSARETAAADGVIQATDRLSRALRERLGESLRSIRQTDPLAQVTTHSLDALRRYSQGVRAHDAEADPRRAIVLLREATEDDSAFAMAWRKLGIAYQYVDRDSMAAAVTRAFEHRDRLTDRERYLTEGTYYDIVGQDTTRAMSAYETLLELHPTESAGLNNLGRLYVMRGNLGRAAELYERAVAAHPYAATPYRNWIGVLTRLGRHDEAAAAVDAYDERFPDHYYVPRMRGQIATARFDYDEGWRQAELLATHEGREQEAGLNLAAIAMVRGRHQDALRRFLTEAGNDSTSPEVQRQLLETRVFMDIAHHLDPGAGADRMTRTLSDAALGAMPVDERPYYPLIMVHLLAGRTDRARRYIEDWRRAAPDAFQEPTAGVREVLAELRLAEGDAGPILAERRRAIADGCFPCRVQLGRAFEVDGMPDSAMVAYQDYLAPDDNPTWRLHADRIWLPYVFQRLAVLHEERGDTTRAVEFHARLLDLWRDADPGLQPRVDAAHSALVRLAGET